MTDDYINYGKFVDEAMHYVVKRALKNVEEYGLPRDHHFFITFETKYPGVMISDELLSKYPEEMTIIVQHQFWNLEVEEDNFSIVLSFDNVQQSMKIPFDALMSFADPSVKFGLQFHKEMSQPKPSVTNSPSSEVDLDNKKHQNNVVTLDSFRKK